MKIFELYEEQSDYVIYVDLDGVLADFEKGVLDLLGKSAASIPDKEMWPQLANTSIEPETPHHSILTTLQNSEMMSKDLAQRTRALKTLARLGLIDKTFSGITEKGNAVLVDLDAGKGFTQGPSFFANLDMMPDAMQLWNYVKKYNPIILTGVPMGNWAPPQKEQWVAANLGSNVQVITGMSRDKHNYAASNHILIDDIEKNIDKWNQAGGIGILHTNANESINELKGLGL